MCSLAAQWKFSKHCFPSDTRNSIVSPCKHSCSPQAQQLCVWRADDAAQAMFSSTLQRPSLFVPLRSTIVTYVLARQHFYLFASYLGSVHHHSGRLQRMLPSIRHHLHTKWWMWDFIVQMGPWTRNCHLFFLLLLPLFFPRGERRKKEREQINSHWHFLFGFLAPFFQSFHPSSCWVCPSVATIDFFGATSSVTHESTLLWRVFVCGRERDNEMRTMSTRECVHEWMDDPVSC